MTVIEAKKRIEIGESKLRHAHPKPVIAIQMNVVDAGVVEIVFETESGDCRHRVPWGQFCQLVLMTDLAVRHGTDPISRLADRLLGVRQGNH